MHIEGQVQVKANPLNIDREMILADKKTETMSKDFDELETAFDTLLVLSKKEEKFKGGKLQTTKKFKKTDFFVFSGAHNFPPLNFSVFLRVLL